MGSNVKIRIHKPIVEMTKMTTVTTFLAKNKPI